MNIPHLEEKASECIRKIKEISFQELPISAYNKQYIQRIFPHLEYLFQIYIEAFSTFKDINADNIIVDFGGGHGFLSLYLKSIGYKVVYCDYNPLSVETIRVLKEQLGFGPDYIISGSSKELKDFFQSLNLIPTHLISTDLIEHVYDLNSFFQDLKQINPDLEMVFTTGSNPYNFLKCCQLRKDMKREEKKYFILRKHFIQKYTTGLGESTIHKLAQCTRGKNFRDIQQDCDVFLNTGRYPIPLRDKYNTCNPETSSWDERILSFHEYRTIINRNGFNVTFSVGYYNEITGNKKFLHKIFNSVILNFGELGFLFAPYILLKVEK